MSAAATQNQILAFAVYELRLLLAGQLGEGTDTDPAVRSAAHLAYALHNQALAVLEGREFDVPQAINAIARVDNAFGENFVEQLAKYSNLEA